MSPGAGRRCALFLLGFAALAEACGGHPENAPASRSFQVWGIAECLLGTSQALGECDADMWASVKSASGDPIHDATVTMTVDDSEPFVLSLDTSIWPGMFHAVHHGMGARFRISAAVGQSSGEVEFPGLRVFHPTLQPIVGTSATLEWIPEADAAPFEVWRDVWVMNGDLELWATGYLAGPDPGTQPVPGWAVQDGTAVWITHDLTDGASSCMLWTRVDR